MEHHQTDPDESRERRLKEEMDQPPQVTGMSPPSGPQWKAAFSTYDQTQQGVTEIIKGRIIFDALLENIPEAILIADADNLSLNVASKYGILSFALPPEKVLRHTFEEVMESVQFFEEDGFTPVPWESHPMARALKGEKMEDVGLVLQNANGQRMSISCKGGPIRDAEGKILAAIFSYMDISERVQDKEALAEYARRLEQSNQELEKFAFVASHDMKEPLRKIQSFSKLLAEKYQAVLGTEGADLLRRMQNASVRLSQLIEDLLAYSRLSTTNPAFTRTDLNEIVREVISDLETEVDRYQGQVILEPLPFVSADEGQISQLFQNLIVNALKFHRPGIPPIVRVTTSQGKEERQGFVQVAVEDNGIGFNLDQLDTIFQPFQRLHGRSEYEGSGIGLAICVKIAERHGGKITAISQPGNGSTFFVDLPLNVPGGVEED